MKLPKHEGALFIGHNEYKNYYMEVAEWVHEYQGNYSWANGEETRKRCVETGDVWTLQWYPHNPLGQLSIAASTFEELMAWAAEVDPRGDEE